MAIAYPLSLPTPRFVAAVVLGGRSTVAVTASPFTLASQVQAWPGQQWFARVTTRPMREADARAWIAWLLSLNGREGTFLMGDPLRTRPRGIGTGAPLVKGAGQTGQTLITDGWTPGVTGILKAGDLIQLGAGATAYLHAVLADVNSDGSGNATFDIWPRLRVSPSDSAPITLSNPMARWRMTSNDARWDVRVGQVYGFEFECSEAL